MSLKLKVMPLAVAQVIAGGAFSVMAISPVMAQQAADQQQSVQRIEITGSNIRRADAETPSPVQVISADDMKKSGYTSVSEVLRNITANGQGTLSQSFASAFAAGASGVALRGLTVGDTLVLIDGHRMTQYPLSDDGERSFVDISAIPFDAIERIEVLKDGASAVYGSDAIAGVVNVILKKSYSGTNVTAETGTSQQGGGTTNHMSIIHGWGNLDEDGYAAYASLEFRKQDAIMLNQRQGQNWTNGDFSSVGGINTTPGSSGYFYGPVVSTPYFINSANTSQTAFGTGSCNATSFANNGCQYISPYAQLQPNTENINLLTSFTKKLQDGWEFDIKGSIFDSKAQQVNGTSPNIGNAGNINAGATGGGYLGNTAYSAGVAPHQVGIIPSFTVPVGYPGNPFSAPAYVQGLLSDLGAPTTDIDSKSYRLVAELSGTIGGWDVNSSLGLTRINTEQRYHNYLNYTSLDNALNYSAAAPNGAPGLYTFGGSNSAAVLNYISPLVQGMQSSTLDFAEVRGSRSLMTLAGGDLGIGTGASFVHRALDAPAAELFSSGIVGGGNAAYAIGQQNDASAYVELVAPVLKTLELDGAARVDHYDTYGNSFTPKFGFKYTPTDQVALRGTVSTGFRAPNAAEAGSTNSVFYYNAVNDPQLCASGNPNAPKSAPAYCASSGFFPSYFQTPNASLQPEKSKSATFGLILEPIKGWSTTLDYYYIDINNQIITSSELPGFSLAGAVRSPTPTQLNDGTFGPGAILYIPSTYVNANSTHTSGIEFETRYKFKMHEYGNLTTTLQITHMFDYIMDIGGTSYELAGTHGPAIVSGDTGNPKNRAQAIFSYDKGTLNVTTTLNWVGSYDLTDPSQGWNTCLIGATAQTTYFAGATSIPNQYCKVSSFLDTDLTARYQVNKNWTLHAGITNLFNQAPPIDIATYGALSGNVGAGFGMVPYNPSLAQSGAVGRFFNIGAAYKF
ncbi:MAG: TonB-dependent receptor [Burkholderiaceae bacterium]|nr:TonB-dependent receptor [Burkholderiaceae bacterium]